MAFRYILKRILALLPTLFLLSFLIFSLLFVAGGSPAATILGMEASPEAVAALNAKMGYDRPFLEQYGRWLSGALQGNLGASIFLKKNVSAALAASFPVSLELALLSLSIALLIALPLGIRAAERPQGAADRLLSHFCMIFLALPSFVLSLVLVIVFSLLLKVLPSSGFVPLSTGLLPHLKTLLLPSLALALTQAAVIGRMTRQSLAEIRSRFFLKSLKARGISRHRLLYSHLLKNAFIPILTIIGERFAAVLAGAVIVETVFQLPGLGMMMMNAIKRRDIPLVQGVLLLVSCIYLTVNLLTDLLYGVFDPRIRLEKEAAQ